MKSDNEFSWSEFGRFEFLGQSVSPDAWIITNQGRWFQTKLVSIDSPPTSENFSDIDEYIEVYDAWEKARDAWRENRNRLNSGSTHEHKSSSNIRVSGSGSVQGGGQYGYQYDGYGSYTYSPSNYTDGVDRKKWPNTFKFLLKFHYAKDFSKNTKYVYRREKKGS